MKNSTSRFFCWVLAIASILVSILILAAPIFEFDLTLIRTLNLPWCFRPDATLMDFVEIPWCAVALFSPCVFLLLFAILRGEDVKDNLRGILLPLGVLVLSIFLSPSPDAASSERSMDILFSGAASFFYIIITSVLFYHIINGDDGPSSSSGSGRDQVDDLLHNMTDDVSSVDTTGLWP